MGYAYTVELPAAGTGSPLPINVTGQTHFGGDPIIQFAYDINGFDTGQIALFNCAQGQQVFHFREPTVLWVRQDPGLVGAPAATLYVWTDIGSVSV